MAQKRAKTDPFEDLTWEDLQEWAGASSVSRGRSYQRSGRVHGLARPPGGGLIAWVQGTSRYATKVEIHKGKLTAPCTCPLGGTCKHAVAVVLAYLECLKQKQTVPTVTESDQRLKAVRKSLEKRRSWEEGRDEWDGDEDEDTEWEEDEDEDGDEDEWEERVTRPSPRRAKKTATDDLSSFLEQQSKEDLLALLKEQAAQHPTVRQALQDKGNLLSGAVKKLVKTVREEISALGSGPDWDDEWGRGGSGVDYARIRKHLEALLAAGHADEVIHLGKELLEAGARQVEMGHDEGEEAEEITSCMDIVFRALPQTSLSPAEQMLWAIDTELQDEYDFCQGADRFWKQMHAAADWNVVTEKLALRLQHSPSAKGEDNFSRNYRRDRVADWLIMALENAGREDEIIPLCEQEAEKTGSYARLIEHLKHARRWEEVEQWAHKGIKATQQRLPGIASQLRTTLRELREREKDWPRVAAFYAEDFFQQPGVHTFQELQKAAKRAGVELAVRAAAMHYLETGELPQVAKRTKKGETIPPWPLPETGAPAPTERQQLPAPMIVTLIDIAIAEKRPDEVLRWYDQQKPKTTSWGPGWGYGWVDEDRIATAVVDAHPNRAITMWKKAAENQIAQTSVRSYESAATYLRKIQRVLKKLDREPEWKSYLAKLRQANIRKPRCVEILDGLAGRRIID
jgi:uncharacterized Zn finger protein